MTSRTRKELRLNTWKRIPHSIKEEMDEIATFTKRTGREGSITFGIKKNNSNRIQVCANAKGDQQSTETPNCGTDFGDIYRLGDAHSHPYDTNTIGILPSPADITSTFTDSKKARRPQTSCITSQETPLIVCYEPKKNVSTKKAREYASARNQYNRSGSERYYANNINKDLDFALFGRRDGIKRRYPPASEVIDAAFGASVEGLRRDVEPLGRERYCQYSAELMGQGNRVDVIKECKKELTKRSFLGFEF